MKNLLGKKISATDTSQLFTYEGVEKLTGEKLTAAKLLDFVRKTVSEYALTKILKDPQLGA